MRIYSLVFMLLGGLACQTVSAQSEPKAIPTQDPGVARATLIDNAQVRILRVEIQPGGIRRIHTHDDVRFHLFLPVSGTIELTIGSAKPVNASVGQAYYLEKSTPHGFRNPGTSLAMALEVFVKQGAPLAEREARDLATVLAAAYSAPR
jgi:quercetin dioxygenase-like cupin family protein